MKTKIYLIFFTIIIMHANTKSILANFESSNPYAVSLTESEAGHSKPISKPDKQGSKIQQLKGMQPPEAEARNSYIARVKQLLPTKAPSFKAIVLGLVVNIPGVLGNHTDDCFQWGYDEFMNSEFGHSRLVEDELYNIGLYNGLLYCAGTVFTAISITIIKPWIFPKEKED